MADAEEKAKAEKIAAAKKRVSTLSNATSCESRDVLTRMVRRSSR
jgi:hypothetical protein